MRLKEKQRLLVVTVGKEPDEVWPDIPTPARSIFIRALELVVSFDAEPAAARGGIPFISLRASGHKVRKYVDGHEKVTDWKTDEAIWRGPGAPLPLHGLINQAWELSWKG